jgi:hypothetical protein
MKKERMNIMKAVGRKKMTESELIILCQVTIYVQVGGGIACTRWDRKGLIDRSENK